MLPAAIDFEAISWQSTLPASRFKVFQAEGKQLRLLELSAGFTEPEWCEKGHSGFVLEGTLAIDFAGREAVYPSGSGILISPGLPHKAKPLTPVVRLLLCENA